MPRKRKVQDEHEKPRIKALEKDNKVLNSIFDQLEKTP